MPWRFVILTLTATVGLGGCHCCERPACVAERPYSCNRYGDFPQPPRMITAPAAQAPATFVPPAAPPASIDRPVPAPPGEVNPAGGSADSGMASAPESTPPSVRLGPPGPIRRESASLPAEDATKEPPLANVPGKSPPRGAEGRDADKEAQAAIDLPGFAEAVPGVASGLKPFPDGVTLLAEKGYKTVLHLHARGEDTTAARLLFERKGLRYLSLEVSPARLTKEAYQRFVGYVKDTTIQPLFVFDKDGSLAGGLWYLYFRVELRQSDETARAEAQRLKLEFGTNAPDSHKAMWLAVQNLRDALKP
jgi:hypothetical protein